MQTPSASQSPSIGLVLVNDESNEPHQVQRLRRSCDNCASAKVKCDKEHPKCGRCAGSNATCFYGISRKYGKQKHKSSHTPIPRRLSMQRRDSDNCSEIQDQNRGFHNSNQTGTYVNPHLSAFEDPVHKMPWMGTNSDVTDLFSIDDDWSSVLTTTPVTSTPLLNGSPWQTHPKQLEDVFPGGIRNYQEESLPTIVPVPLTYPSKPMTPGSSTQATPTGSEMQIDNQNTRPSSSSRPRTGTSQSCFSLARSTLQTLCQEPKELDILNQSNSRPHLQFVFPYHGLNNSSDSLTETSVPSVQHILQINKAALTRLFQLVKSPCNCTSDPQHAMLYSSILGRILQWYREIAIQNRNYTDSRESEPRMGEINRRTNTAISALGNRQCENCGTVSHFSGTHVHSQAPTRTQGSHFQSGCACSGSVHPMSAPSKAGQRTLSPTLSTSSSSSIPSSHHCTGIGLPSTEGSLSLNDLPITIGNLDLDDTDRVLLGRQILLSELGKARQVIDALAERWSPNSQDEDKIDDWDAETDQRFHPTRKREPQCAGEALHQALIGWLKQQLKMIVKEVMSMGKTS